MDVVDFAVNGVVPCGSFFGDPGAVDGYTMADVAAAFASRGWAAVVVEDLVVIHLDGGGADLVGVEAGDAVVAGAVCEGEVADFEAVMFGDV